MINKQVDCVVIGGGNGGLSSAVRVLMGGKSCLVLERHNLPGGFATSFKRGRFEFEASLHELCDLGSSGDPGDLRKYFRQIGIEKKVDWIKIPDAFRAINKEGLDVTMPCGVNEFIEKMEFYVKGSKKSMKELFELADEIMRALTYISQSNGKPNSKILMQDYKNFLKSGSYSVNEVFKALKIPKKAQDILNSYWVYIGVDCNRVSFIHYISMVYRFLLRNAYVPKARSHEISLAFEERIRELGGEIWYNSEVVKILTDENKKITGVKLADGTQIATKHIIANISPHMVNGKLLDKEVIPQLELKATNTRKLAGRGFMVFLGLNKSAKELGIKDYNYMIYETSNSVKTYEMMKNFETNNVQATVCLNVVNPDVSPKGTCELTMTTLFTSDVWSKVEEKDYFKVKSDFANKMIDNFENATGIKIKHAIEEISIATPVSYARYGGHPEGVIYGYEAGDWDSFMPRMQMLAEDYRIEGLRYTGGFAMRAIGYSSTYMSGDIAGKQTIGDIKKDKEEK